MKDKNKVPFSEDEQKQHHEWDQEMCIAEIQRLARQNPEKAMSRNFFRNESQISESTWTRYFGTFTEFKRQADIIPSRQAHKLEKDIAKHASVEHYKEFNKERNDWGSKYIRTNKTRFQTIITISDLHDIEVDPFYMEVVVDTIKRIKPDIICIVGDLFDLPEFSRFDVDPRTWDVVGRIEAAHKILSRIRNASPESQITLVEGNHEYRLVRHLADASPAMLTVLSDLHGFNVSKLLGLDKFEVNYIAKADLGAYRVTDIKKEVAKSYAVFFDCFLAHHHPEGSKFGMAGVNGHHHSAHMQCLYNEMFGSYNWFQLPGGHKKDASYCNGQKWQNGFAINHIDTHKKFVNIEPVIITDFACVGGKYYYKEDV